MTTDRTHVRHPEQFAIVRDATATLCMQHVPSALIVAPHLATCLPCAAIVRAVGIPDDLLALLLDNMEACEAQTFWPNAPRALAEWMRRRVA